jgi:hypothetical protein
VCVLCHRPCSRSGMELCSCLYMFVCGALSCGGVCVCPVLLLRRAATAGSGPGCKVGHRVGSSRCLVAWRASWFVAPTLLFFAAAAPAAGFLCSFPAEGSALPAGPVLVWVCWGFFAVNRPGQEDSPFLLLAHCLDGMRAGASKGRGDPVHMPQCFVCCCLVMLLLLGMRSARSHYIRTYIHHCEFSTFKYCVCKSQPARGVRCQQAVGRL